MSLTLIFSYIGELIMSSIMIYSYSKLSSKKIDFKLNKILIILILCFLVIINNYYNYITLRFLTSIFLSVIINWIMFRDTIKNTIYYTFIYSIISIILEISLSSLLIKNINLFNNELLLKSCFSFIECFLLLIIINKFPILKFLRKIKQNFNFYSVSLTLLLFFNILL